MARMGRPKRPDKARSRPEPGLDIYEGYTVKRTRPGRWIAPGLKYGEGPGEYLHFNTRKEAREFIDRWIVKKKPAARRS